MDAPPDPVGVSSVLPRWVSDSEVVPVGFTRRLGARILDTAFTLLCGVVAGVVGAILVGVLAALGHARGDWLQAIGQSRPLDYAWSFAGSSLYHVISEALAGASLGKLLLGMRVLREDQRPCDLRGAVIRELAFFVDGLVFGLPAYSSMSDSPMQQRLGDRWGGTIVVTAASVPALSRRGPGLIAVGVLGGIGAATACSVLATVLKGF